jgi:hypothetical protein
VTCCEARMSRAQIRGRVSSPRCAAGKDVESKLEEACQMRRRWRFSPPSLITGQSNSVPKAERNVAELELCYYGT